MAVMTKNFCIEPTLEGCTCATNPVCGGITEVDLSCPEHGVNVIPEDLIDTHFHYVGIRGYQ